MLETASNNKLTYFMGFFIKSFVLSASCLFYRNLAVLLEILVVTLIKSWKCDSRTQDTTKHVIRDIVVTYKISGTACRSAPRCNIFQRSNKTSSVSFIPDWRSRVDAYAVPFMPLDKTPFQVEQKPETVCSVSVTLSLLTLRRWNRHQKQKVVSTVVAILTWAACQAL